MLGNPDAIQGKMAFQLLRANTGMEVKRDLPRGGSFDARFGNGLACETIQQRALPRTCAAEERCNERSLCAGVKEGAWASIFKTLKRFEIQRRKPLGFASGSGPISGRGK
jgi:hypothetical protein